MPTSACCSAMTSGVAMSVHLDRYHAVPHRDRERVHGLVGGEVQGLSGPQVELGSVPGAFDRARGLVELALHQQAVVVRAAVLDGEEPAVAVEDADLEVLPCDQAHGARGKLGDGADVDGL